jgi:hypothetical protein
MFHPEACGGKIVTSSDSSFFPGGVSYGTSGPSWTIRLLVLQPKFTGPSWRSRTLASLARRMHRSKVRAPKALPQDSTSWTQYCPSRLFCPIVFQGSLAPSFPAHLSACPCSRPSPPDFRINPPFRLHLPLRTPGNLTTRQTFHQPFNPLGPALR